MDLKILGLLGKNPNMKGHFCLISETDYNIEDNKTFQKECRN